MTELLEAVRQFGLPMVGGAVVLYLLLRGELSFRYPARRRGKRDR